MLGYVVIWAVLYGIATLTMLNDGGLMTDNLQRRALLRARKEPA